MDFLECSICHVHYDENDHRPRNSPCGHEYCSACLKTLIKNGEYVCPKCRKKIKVNIVDELPVNFGLIDVIRAFKANTFSVTNAAESKGSEASNDVCSIHCKPISHWCSECQLWICVDCHDSHNSLIGCSTTIATKAMEDFKDNHNKAVSQLMSKFEERSLHVTSKIQEHTDKRKELLEMAEKHGEKVEELQNILLQGNIHREDLLVSKKHLNETFSPHALSHKMKVMTQRKQTMLSWVAKNIGEDAPLDSQQDLLKKILKENNCVYVEKMIKDGKKHGKITQYDGRFYVHTFQTQPIYEKSNCVPLQKMIPWGSSLVFLDLSQEGVKRGRVHLHLNVVQPNIKDNFIQLVTGECGPSLRGIILGASGSWLSNKENLLFSEVSVSHDILRETTGIRGNICGYYDDGYLKGLHVQLVDTYNYSKGYYIIGNVLNDIEILQECANKKEKISISDCGFVIDPN